jgi:hypothetical protein
MERNRFFVMLASSVVVAFCLHSHCLGGDIVQAVSRVADIRFGVIEPPVVAQKDITVRAPMSNQRLESAELECSGMAWVNGSLWLASDRHSHSVFTAAIDLDQMVIKSPAPVVVIKNEQDLIEDCESMTVKPGPNGTSVAYMLSSLSNERSEMALPKRQHMLRFALPVGERSGATHVTVIDMRPVRDMIDVYLKKGNIEHYRTYFQEFPGRNKNTYRWGNVEGMAFTPDGSSLLCGMRNPLSGDSAIIFVLQSVDEAFDARDPSRLKVIDMFTLPLGCRGVSDLCWDPVTKGYLITAATCNGPRLSEDQPWPPNELDSALFWWSGRKNEKPVLVSSFPDMKIEAVCRLGTSRYIAVGSDEADVSEGRTSTSQSILTVIYFTGLELPR